MRWLLLVLLAGSPGCPSEPPPACIMVDTTCAPGYVPTFANVYKNTLSVSCGNGNSSCHSPTGHMGGLVLDSQGTAYTGLTAQSQIDPTRLRVVPGDPACSLLIVRTDSPGKDYQMPKGDPLSEPERCALVQWVEMGAMP
jgi:hypothetical protein